MNVRFIHHRAKGLHARRDTRVGPQCQCGAPFWTRRHRTTATIADAVRRAIGLI